MAVQAAGIAGAPTTGQPIASAPSRTATLSTQMAALTQCTAFETMPFFIPAWHESCISECAACCCPRRPQRAGDLEPGVHPVQPRGRWFAQDAASPACGHRHGARARHKRAAGEAQVAASLMKLASSSSASAGVTNAYDTGSWLLFGAFSIHVLNWQQCCHQKSVSRRAQP